MRGERVVDEVLTNSVGDVCHGMAWEVVLGSGVYGGGDYALA